MNTGSSSNKTRIGIAVLALAGLPACQVSLFFGDAERFEDREDRFSAMVVRQTALPETLPGDLPAGPATYRGYAELATPTDLALGEMTLTADFGTDGVSGSVTDVISDRFGTLDGALSVTNGIIAGNGFDADLDGTLTGSGFATTYDATVTATFRGPNAEGLLGTLSGDATTGGLVEPLTGRVVAEN